MNLVWAVCESHGIYERKKAVGLTNDIRIVHCGVGSLGTMVLHSLAGLAGGGVKLVGAVDPGPGKLGLPIREVIGLEDDHEWSLEITEEWSSTPARLSADVVLHTTGSVLPEVLPQLEEILEDGKSIISTCEELVNPQYRYPEIASRLDGLARENGAVIVGTGINPGFVMDVLPLVLSSVNLHPKRVSVRRYQDAGHRRAAFQQKIGVGLSVSEFSEKVASQQVRHAGLRESAAMIADKMELGVVKITEEITPIVAEERLRASNGGGIEPGQVAGCQQIAKGWRDDDAVVTLDMKMSVGQTEAFDWILIEGDDRIEFKIVGGLAGDSATVARLLNTIPIVMELSPGLYTPADLPTVHARAML